MAARAGVLESFARGVPYFNTFGGNPVTMAGGAAVLDVIEDEKLMANAASVGTSLRTELAALSRDHPRIGDVRGAGLYIGIEIVDEAGESDRTGAKKIVNAMREHRVLISVCGRDGNVLKVRPPLVFSESDVDWFCTAFADVCIPRTDSLSTGTLERWHTNPNPRLRHPRTHTRPGDPGAGATGAAHHREIDPSEEHQRLRAIETELDQCWDLLRQRRALRETAVIRARPRCARPTKSRVISAEHPRQDCLEGGEVLVAERGKAIGAGSSVASKTATI